MTFVDVPAVSTQRDVRTRLVEIANESAESRSQVVETLVRLLEDPGSKEESDPAYRWTAAVRVLGELKATEAINVLVQNLNETGESALSRGYRPVVGALRKIGKPAVPRLIEALSSDQATIRSEATSALALLGQPAFDEIEEALLNGSAYAKEGAAMALAFNGGRRARSNIQRAIQRETNPESLAKLKDALEAMCKNWGHCN